MDMLDFRLKKLPSLLSIYLALQRTEYISKKYTELCINKIQNPFEVLDHDIGRRELLFTIGPIGFFEFLLV